MGFFQPGKPAHKNAIKEQLNRTFREDILDAYLITKLRDVLEMAYEWM
jgi:putative transposase